MKQSKFQHAYHKHNVPGEKNSGISETKPNQALSVDTILNRFAGGLNPEQIPQQFSMDMQDLRGKDISELHEIVGETREKMEGLKYAMREKQKQKQAAAKEAEMAALEEKLAAKYKTTV
ncbi:MAG: hypothetical protein [Microviridae sp.]|nr:MAG: hypothetical protein [Microviridae sp.]